MMTDRSSSAMQTLFTPLVARHVKRLLTHLVVNYTSITDVIYLLHVLTTSTSSYHTRAIYLG